jgi:AcrR family transcriptional regulator
MALYRHVESRDELLVLMVDAALGPPPGPASGPWPAAVRRWGTALLRRHEAHRRTLDAPIPGRPAPPHLVAWVDRLLVDLEPSGLPMAERLDVALLVAGHVRHIATVRLRPDRLRPAESPGDLRSWLPQLATPGAFPAYAQALAEAAGRRREGPPLVYGLDRIVAGVEARAAALGRGSTRTSSRTRASAGGP